MKELPARLNALREKAKQGRDPACPDETFSFLLETAAEIAADGRTVVTMLITDWQLS